MKQTSRAQALNDNLVFLRELGRTKATSHPVGLPLAPSIPFFGDDVVADNFSDPCLLALRRSCGLASPMLTERQAIRQVA